MNTEPSNTAKARLAGDPSEPFLFADWEHVVFLHFKIAPELLAPHVPQPFQLELWEGDAWLSIVALTMRRFRAGCWASMAALASGLGCQRFLNFRTYVSARGGPGAYFIHGWLSRPWGLPWPSCVRGFPYAFADAAYEARSGGVAGRVSAFGRNEAFAFAVKTEPRSPELVDGNAGRVSGSFLLERYAGYFVSAGQPRVFHTWHPPWLQVGVEAVILDRSLVTSRFPWFQYATFTGAHYAPGFKDVWLGRLHRLKEAGSKPRRALSAFFEMP